MEYQQKKKKLFKKGKSGNPSGRPLGSFSLVAMLKNKLQEHAKDMGRDEKETYAHVLVEKVINLAINGDTALIKDLINRVDGMPQQKLDHTSDGKPIAILGGTTNVISEDNSNREATETEEES